MTKLAPFNITIIDPDEYIQRKQCLPVSSHSMYESSTDRFHPDGLYSEVIFGQLGSRERLIRRGFMYLRTTLISPHLYRQLITLKGFYRDILAGKQYAYFDKETKDFIRTSRDDPNAGTGYAFFLEHLDKLQFKPSASAQRNDKITLIDKYRDRLRITKFIILPAALRDVRIKDGRAESEKINKLYLNLLSLTKSLPEDASDPIFDPIRFQMQNKIQEIYEYIRDLIDDKHGFAQGKYAARDIVYGSRNVITSPLLTRTTAPDAPNTFSIDEVLIPLFEGLKSLVPIIVNVMTTRLLATVFDRQSSVAALINPKTLRLEQVEVDSKSQTRYTTADGINDIINDFRDNAIHFQPVTAKLAQPVTIDGETITEYYVRLVYDTGGTILFVRDVDEFRQMYAKTYRYRDNNPYVHILENYPPEQYVIEGTGALYACGMEIEPQDIDVIMHPNMYSQFELLAKERRIEPDEFGDYEIMFGDIELHIKNNCYKVKTEADWEKFKQEQVIQIGEHFYIKPEVLAARYRAMAGKSERVLKDRRKLEFFNEIIFDPSKLRPMTYMELMYIACHIAMKGKHYTVTRHPVLNLFNIYPVKGHLVSTEPSRVVKVIINTNPLIQATLDSYPIIGATSKQSLAVHPATLGHLDGDHDGVHYTVLPSHTAIAL